MGKNGKGSAAGETQAVEENTGPAAEAQAAQQLDPAVLAKIAELRTHVRESFGKTVMAMMVLPRYRNQTLADLQHLVLEPLLRDRIAIAYPSDKDVSPANDIAGLAIWASVSEEVDARIREQIKAGTFPVRLKSEDWTSGDRNWLLDVIAPDKRSTANVIANFKQVVKQGSLRLHPMVTRLVDEETLRKMGAEKFADAPAPAPVETAPEGETIN
ncbi:toxin-activating lysine-acyltransferase [Sphingomonas sp.]|uniref:toxin-activating lysine-acyltransferase n=1 Tax=Sphingomonas sp. TaxID=28214 RepID=UPI0025FCEF27|nr:toxin-activating lysine-acyltransferase [Sphingomonas sp.]